jgi:type IV pilus assembly protein PilC
MPNFIFRVGTQDGEIVERQIQAMDMTTAREEITRQGLHVFEAKRGSISLRDLLPRTAKVMSTERFLLFNQELLALVRAGLPIIHSFDIMLERQKNAHFRQILTEIRDKVKSGIAISDAFASYGDLFPAIYATSIRSGERSGDLEGVLRRFLKYQKLIVNLRKRVIGALIYPTVLVSLSLVMIFIMLTVVIPKFSEFYAGFGAELPAFTQFAIDLAYLIRHNALMLLGGLVLAFFLVRRWSSTRLGGMAFDRFKLRIPLAGGILHRFGIMQFTQSLGTLLSGGTPMVPALEIASVSVTNQFISSRIAGIVQNVRQGETLWRSLESTAVISDLAVEMIKVGESTGSVVEMLANVSEFYDEEIEARLSRMVALIEPMILVIMGGVIALLLYAFYLPLFELTSVGQT